MIDRSARDEYAQLLRHFAAGRVVNLDYEKACDEFLKSSDSAIGEIYDAMWPAYCDMRRHKMSGDWTLNQEERRTVARWVLFLHSSLEYEYPVETLGSRLLNILTLGIWRRLRTPIGPTGEQDIWPFFRRPDYEAQLGQPRLLAGAR